MATTDARRWVSPLAVACFWQQTWPADRRELVLAVEPGEGPRWDAWLDPGSYGAVRVVEVKAPTLGEKFNAAVAAARGPVVALWEDDDWHHPERLSRQLESWERALAAPRSRKLPPLAFAASRRLPYWDLRSDEVSTLDASPGWCHGSFVGMRDAWLACPYPAMGVGADGAWMDAVGRRYAVHETPLDDPPLYVATRHGANHWPARGAAWLRRPGVVAEDLLGAAYLYREVFRRRSA
jgi:glycosyltransferase involved in cell wall biosynthesis